MITTSISTLLTCRYWAFGPRCPDIDQYGVNNCRFAHWDTGRLTDFHAQCGTCPDWYYRRNCRFVANCLYEHRDTGMMGLRQGVIELYGLNLQIADAASKAGFNTRDSAALMDLIWAVRRIAYCGGTEHGNKMQRPPHHPVYPDRYRPGDPSSDNTKNPRKRVRENIDSGPTAANLPKRPRTSTKQRVPYQSQPILPQKALNAVHFHNSFNGPSINHPLPIRPNQKRNVGLEAPKQVPQNSSNEAWSNHQLPIRTTQNKTYVDLDAPKRVSEPPPYHELKSTLKPRDPTIVDLRKVIATFKDNAAAISECGNVMKKMYSRDERLAQDSIYADLMLMNDKFGASTQLANELVKITQTVVGLLEDNKENVIESNWWQKSG